MELTRELTIADLGGGAILERMEFELKEVIDDCFDVNKVADSPREILCKLKIKPDAQRTMLEVRQGVSMRQEVEFKNPVILQPFRTFPEIKQPESEFVFRIHIHEQDNGITCSLHEADGSAWKLKAITGIRDYFKEQLPDIPVIA